MVLKSVKIINWQCIENITISFEDLMLFIGQNNSGKTSIMNAIMTFLCYRNFRDRDLRISKPYTEIEGVFKNKNKKFVIWKDYLIDHEDIRIKVRKEFLKEPNYYIYINESWKKLEEKDYKKIVNSFFIIYIPAFVNRQKINFIVKSIIKILSFSPRNLNYLKNMIRIMSEENDKINPSYGQNRNLIYQILGLISHETERKKANLLKDTLILFEEPEIYLHPQKEKELSSFLRKLSKFKTQIYISTHSSHFISIYQYQSICIVRRENNGPTKIFQYKGKLLSGDETKIFNMNYWINPDRSELFFAQKVILVEGQTDKIVLNYSAKKLKINKFEYSIIECGSKSIIPYFIKILNAFKIPYIVVYDKDNHYWRTEEEIFNSNTKNEYIQNLINYNIGDYVEFDNDIEEEIYCEKRERKNYKNKPFSALKHVSQKDYRFSKIFEEKIRKIFK